MNHILAGVAGFEPTKCWNQNPVPYRLAIPLSFMGRVMGIEPTTSRTTILRSNQLSYTRHMVRLKGFEPLTLGLEGRCSIQLSYRCIKKGLCPLMR